MSALTVDPAPGHGTDWDDLVRIWEETDAPEGCKVEIIEEIVTVSPPPSKDHNTTAELLQRRLYTVIPEEWGIYQTLGLSLPGRGGIYIPDLVVMERALLVGPGHTVPASEARLVVEITSRANANHDRVSKVNGYAKAGVELFLLLDPWHSGRPTATLYGEPDGGTYRVLETVEYGRELTLPEPFGLVLDTGVLPAG
ncbi:Uma2 family endonuclease [Streptomyces californicus]|uniref:Uma2 family endonuclease n=1 Tax=Streptomyces globisporus TaxID=1908 RepID=A0A927GN43_STRGL|nr:MULTISPECIES: Uma2 family endonuclease [Streptomyces]MBD2829171.1 Uma2 family endonuclease [Streptomyces globisporus]NEC46359.1 Uma2 family endonuclease [Streptomyces sp. SID8016]QRV54873.1 Uma2 family endonuclease [Streptomyces californicus]